MTGMVPGGSAAIMGVGMHGGGAGGGSGLAMESSGDEVRTFLTVSFVVQSVCFVVFCFLVPRPCSWLLLLRSLLVAGVLRPSSAGGWSSTMISVA